MTIGEDGWTWRYYDAWLGFDIPSGQITDDPMYKVPT
jgi:hypothetical protein